MIGKNIKHIRISLKLTQEEFGDKIGVTKNAVSRYEHDKDVPRDAVKIKIAKLSGKSVESIFYS